MEIPAFTHERVRALLGQHPAAKPVLWGTLPETSPAEVMTFVAQGRRSGLLLWRSDDGFERALSFAEGEVVRALSAAPHEGDEVRAVVLALLRDQPGAFSFLGDRSLHGAPGERLSTEELLLDCLRRLDEASRAAD